MKRTWEEAVVRWQTEKPRQPSDWQDPQRIKNLNKFLAGKNLDQITNATCETIIRSMQSRGLKNSTINRNLVPLKVILRWAWQRWNWIDQAPYVRTLREPPGRTAWLTKEQAAALLKELPDHLSDMAAFSLATGLRAANVRLLEWSQVDLERRACWIWADQSKNRNAISVPLTDFALQVLDRRKGIHPVHVFTFNGRYLRQLTNKTWRDAARRAGVEGFTFHGLRHTWASWHVQSGTRTFELQHLGGWKSEKMVARYAHFSAEHLSQTARKCDSIFSELSLQVDDFTGEKAGAGNEARTRDLNLGKDPK